MTGRPKGATQFNKRKWFTHCVKCGCQILNQGSGRPRNNCGNHKKPKRRVLTHMEQREQRLMIAKRRSQTMREFVNEQKLLVGRCAMHPFLNDGQEYLVTKRNLVAFCWDHIDRESKVASLSAMCRPPYNHQDLINEISKCILVCANCHQIKTYESNDYKQIDREIVRLQHPTLFDN